MRTLLVKPAEPENITFRDMSRWAVGVVLVPLIVILLVLFVCFGCATVDKGATTSQKVEPVSTWRAVAFSAAVRSSSVRQIACRHQKATMSYSGRYDARGSAPTWKLRRTARSRHRSRRSISIPRP